VIIILEMSISFYLLTALLLPVFMKSAAAALAITVANISTGNALLALDCASMSIAARIQSVLLIFVAPVPA